LIVLNIGDGLFEPSQAGLISKSVGPHMQGRIQGGAQGIQSLARIAGPFIAALAYGYLRGFLYFSEGILVVISLVILFMSISIIKSHKMEENRNETR
jgi:DHA1 family tetracycline resistance protein-like MFS transporter